MSRSNLIMGSGDSATSISYNDAFAIYGLIKRVDNFDISPLWLNRSSDDQLRYVFFDDNGEISLDSKVATSPTTPSSQSLGDWVGVGSATVRALVRQAEGIGYIALDNLQQGTISLQPSFVVNGVINTKNGKPSINFTATNYLQKATRFIQLDSGNDFTAISISSNDISNNLGGIFSNSLNSGNSYSQVNDRRVNNLISLINTVQCNSIIQHDVDSQKLITSVIKQGEQIGYYNGVFQENESWVDPYINDGIKFGILRANAAPLTGSIQELILFPSDKTPDLTGIHTDINSYYNIY